MLAMGGTISSVATAGTAEVSPSLKAEQLIESVPELASVASIEWGDMTTIASFAVTLADMHELALAVEQARADGVDGVVITHGTDTIEETAYALALMVPRGFGIVLTGAMRNPMLPGADGHGNLLAAFLAAAHPTLAHLGPVLVFNDEIHAARFVSKSHSTRPSTFASAGSGPIGEVIEGRVYVWFTPAYDDELGLPDAPPVPRAPLIKVASEIDDLVLRAAIESRPDAVVIEGFGGGHALPPLLDAIDDAIARGIPVVMAPRVFAGRTLERTYRIPGAETDLIDRGVIPAGHIAGHKARLRVIVGRALGREASSLFPVL